MQELNVGLKIPEVTRETKGNITLSISNIILDEEETSEFNIAMLVVCPDSAGEIFCENGGKCSHGTISCDCNHTGYHGDRCENTCLPDVIEVTSNKNLEMKHIINILVFSKQKKKMAQVCSMKKFQLVLFFILR